MTGREVETTRRRRQTETPGKRMVVEMAGLCLGRSQARSTSSIRVLSSTRREATGPEKLLLPVTSRAVALKAASRAGREPGVTEIWTHPWGGAIDVLTCVLQKGNEGKGRKDAARLTTGQGLWRLTLAKVRVSTGPRHQEFAWYSGGAPGGRKPLL